MSDPTVAIVFRNPHPKRSPIDNELYLLRRDGTSSHIHFSDQRASQADEETTRPTRFRRLGDSSTKRPILSADEYRIHPERS
jgi:hypothetical protein